jgi:flagellin-like protein
MNFRKFRKNAKALSPVIASIILIAVTVAVSVVVAAWMGGISLGFMQNSEQVTLTNPVFTTNTITLTARNSGASSVTISSSATIDGVAEVASVPTGESLTIDKGTTQDITITLGSGTFTAGAQYIVNLVSSKGNTFTYTATYNP